MKTDPINLFFTLLFLYLCAPLCSSVPSVVHAFPTLSPRLTLSSDNFRISYPARTARRDVEDALNTLESARSGLLQRLAVASLHPPELPVLDIYVHETTGDFVGATGQPPWVAAATHNRRIELQPLETLRRRGVLITTLRHEYVHAVVEALGKGRAPRWLAEGLSLYISGEGQRLNRIGQGARLPLDELERRLGQPASAQEMRTLYGAAYREVAALIRDRGEASLWRRIASY